MPHLAQISVLEQTNPHRKVKLQTSLKVKQAMLSERPPFSTAEEVMLHIFEELFSVALQNKGCLNTVTILGKIRLFVLRIYEKVIYISFLPGQLGRGSNFLKIIFFPIFFSLFTFCTFLFVSLLDLIPAAGSHFCLRLL